MSDETIEPRFHPPVFQVPTFVILTPVVPERRRTVKPYQPGRSVPADPTAQLGNLRLAVRVIGNLKRLANPQPRQFLGVFAPLGWFSQRLPWTVDHMLVADADRITAERIDSMAVFAPDSSLS